MRDLKERKNFCNRMNRFRLDIHVFIDSYSCLWKRGGRLKQWKICHSLKSQKDVVTTPVNLSSHITHRSGY